MNDRIKWLYRRLFQFPGRYKTEGKTLLWKAQRREPGKWELSMYSEDLWRIDEPV